MATRKQKAAIQKLVENGGKSVSAAMREVGYSPETAKSPSKLTESKSYREFFAEVFTPDYLRQHHKALMNSMYLQHVNFPYRMTDDEIKEEINAVPGCVFMSTKRFMTNATVFFLAPDTKARKEALDMAYKLTGDYAPVKLTDVDPLEGLSDEELDAKLAERKRIADRHAQFKKNKNKPNAGQTR